MHQPERRKTWLACPTHRESLSDFLTVRGFLRETVPTEELTDPASEQPADPRAGPQPPSPIGEQP